MTNDGQDGILIERIIQNICEKMFRGNVISLNPKFVKENKQEKELSDILVINQDVILNFQVKTKVEKKPFSEKDETDLNRISTKISETIQQFKTLERNLKSKDFKVPTIHNFDFLISKYNQKKIGIAVLYFFGEENFPVEEQTAFNIQYTEENCHEVHVFLAKDFDEISKEIDTLPDFLDYLEARKALYSLSKFYPTWELDFLGLFKSNRPLINEIMSKKNYDTILIENGIWDKYSVNTERVKRDNLNKKSYIVDNIIKILYTSIGFEHSDLPYKNSIETLLKQVFYLCSIKRIERRIIGDKIIQIMKKADLNKHPFSFSFLKLENNKALFFLSCREKEYTREVRVKFLNTLMDAAIVRLRTFGINSMIGIVTESLASADRSYDVLLKESVGEIKFDDENYLLELGNKWFGKFNQTTEHEFGEGNA